MIRFSELSGVEIGGLILISFIGLFAIIKFLSWVRLPKERRIKFLKSFIVWYSVHDLHNASTLQSKRFRKSNNNINSVIWTCVVLLIIIYLLGGGQTLDKAPKFDPKKIF